MGSPHQTRRLLTASCALLGFVAFTSLTVAVCSDYWMVTKEPMVFKLPPMGPGWDQAGPGPDQDRSVAEPGPEGPAADPHSGVGATESLDPHSPAFADMAAAEPETTIILLNAHAGLWRLCFGAADEGEGDEWEEGEEGMGDGAGGHSSYPVDMGTSAEEGSPPLDAPPGDRVTDAVLEADDNLHAEESQETCEFIDYQNQWQRVKGVDTTFSILRAMRKATFAIVASLVCLTAGLLVTTVGTVKRNNLSLVGSILLIVTGLLLMLGLVLYVCAVNDEIGHRKKPPKNSVEPVFDYNYGWSFGFACVALLTTNMAAVANVYLYQDEYTAQADDFVQLVPEVGPGRAGAGAQRARAV